MANPVKYGAHTNIHQTVLHSVAVLSVLLGCCRGAEITPKQRTEIGAIYGAENKTPSSVDIQACLNSAKANGEWNRITAVVVRDLLDPQVTAEEWVRSTTAVMPQMRAVVMTMIADARLVSDAGIARSLLPLAEVHRELLDTYTLITLATSEGDKPRAIELTNRLRALGEKKASLGGPIVQKLRSYLGPDAFAKALNDGIAQSAATTKTTTMTIGDQGKAFYEAFVCAELAQKAGDDAEAESLFRWGVKNGREFLASIERSDLSTQERDKVPSAVMLMTKGPSHDFVLGRMYEFAAAEATRMLPKREGGFGMWEQKERAAAKILLAERRPRALGGN